MKQTTIVKLAIEAAERALRAQSRQPTKTLPFADEALAAMSNELRNSWRTTDQIASTVIDPLVVSLRNNTDGPRANLFLTTYKQAWEDGL